MSALEPEPSTVLKAGYRRYPWRDAERDRPVWGDLWYPTTDPSEERARMQGLGRGASMPGATLARQPTPFPIVLLSHGASGSPVSYSWIAEHLARHGFVVLGVAHYGDSWAYGPETIDPDAITRLWNRPADCSFALSQLLAHEDFVDRLDPTRIGALGHSSGGATVASLGGAIIDPAALSAYCLSDEGVDDRGCQYRRKHGPDRPVPAEAGRSYRDPRIKAIVMLDPAAGPAFSDAALAEVRIPALVIGSVENDFLPFEHHAGRYAARLPHAKMIRLDSGEGHFVYLNSCTSGLAANGVPLCADREGVDREAVHARLTSEILGFLLEVLLIKANPG